MLTPRQHVLIQQQMLKQQQQIEQLKLANAEMLRRMQQQHAATANAASTEAQPASPTESAQTTPIASQAQRPCVGG